MNKEAFYKNKEFADEALLFAHQCYEREKERFQDIEKSLALSLMAYSYLRETHPELPLRIFSCTKTKRNLSSEFNNAQGVIKNYFIVIDYEFTSSKFRKKFKSESVACDPDNFLTIKMRQFRNYFISSEYYNDHREKTKTTVKLKNIKEKSIQNELDFFENYIKENINELSLNNDFFNFKIGLEAKRYAEEHIRKSNTALEVNRKNGSIKNMHNMMKKQRTQLKEMESSLSLGSIKYKEKLTTTIQADLYTFLCFWYAINLYETLSQGNCEEKSWTAFSNVFKNHPQINAEVYSLVSISDKKTNAPKGDHDILVIGRDQNTPEHDIEKWNVYAVICDPWSHKVYFVKYYEKHLKNYVLLKTRSKDCRTLCDFNLNDYSLKKHPYVNSTWMSYALSIAKKEINDSMINASKNVEEIQIFFKKLSEEDVLSYSNIFQETQESLDLFVKKEQSVNYYLAENYLLLKNEIDLFFESTTVLLRKLNNLIDEKKINEEIFISNINKMWHHADNKNVLNNNSTLYSLNL